MENAINLIHKNYCSLSVVEKKIADCILAAPERVIYMTTAQLAKEIGVSEGSIINFSSGLGFKGFSALKLDIARNLPQQERAIAEAVSRTDSPHTVLEKLAAEIQKAFQMTISAVQNGELEAAARLISGKKRIEIYGVGFSSMVAMDAYFRFMRQSLPAYAVTDAHIASVSASMLDQDCLAIVISHSGRTVETLKAAQIAKDKGAAIIALTSFANSPLARLSDVCLVSSSRESDTLREAVASRHSQLLLLDALLLYLSMQDMEKTMEQLENMVEIIGDHRTQ